jgi:AcrR family transcriptional regulator
VLVTDTRSQVLDGVMACLARWGIGKTTLDDVAAASGCSRATIYRLFPGGKEALFGALVQREVSGFFADIERQLDEARTLSELLRRGMTAALQQIWDHPALRYVVEHEPGTVVPNLVTAGLGPLVEVAGSFVAPRLRPHVDERSAPIAAEWIVRLTLSYAAAPPPPGQLAATVDHLVEHLLAPAIAGLDLPSPEIRTQGAAQ